MTRQEFHSQTTLALDSNDTASVTAPLIINSARNIILFVEADTGAHTIHVLDIQFSADSVTWHDHATMTITAVSPLFIEGTTNAKFVRAKVSTAQGAASTINVHIQAK